MAKRPAYREAVAWIAINDPNGGESVPELACQITVLLVADLFGKEPTEVASDVWDFCKRYP